MEAKHNTTSAPPSSITGYMVLPDEYKQLTEIMKRVPGEYALPMNHLLLEVARRGQMKVDIKSPSSGGKKGGDA